MKEGRARTATTDERTIQLSTRGGRLETSPPKQTRWIGREFERAREEGEVKKKGDGRRTVRAWWRQKWRKSWDKKGGERECVLGRAESFGTQHAIPKPASEPRAPERGEKEGNGAGPRGRREKDVPHR